MSEDIGLFEAMHTQRAIRHLKPDPVPDDMIDKILSAAICAPSGGNTQRWAFVVVKDRETRRKIAEMYRSVPTPIQQRADAPPSVRRLLASTTYLTEHFDEVPVIILACMRHDGSPGDITRGGSIYPAVQNMLLAIRALGLGSSITTRHTRGFNDQLKKLVGIPDNVDIAALLPVGFPVDGYGYGPTTRLPVKEVTFYERWSEATA